MELHAATRCLHSLFSFLIGGKALLLVRSGHEVVFLDFYHVPNKIFFFFYSRHRISLDIFHSWKRVVLGYFNMTSYLSKVFTAFGLVIVRKAQFLLIILTMVLFSSCVSVGHDS